MHSGCITGQNVRICGRIPQPSQICFVSRLSSAQHVSIQTTDDTSQHALPSHRATSSSLIETLTLNAMACLLTECCKQNASTLDGMLCCTCFCLQFWCTIKQVTRRLWGYAPKSSPSPLPLI